MDEKATLNLLELFGVPFDLVLVELSHLSVTFCVDYRGVHITNDVDISLV